MEHQGSTLLSLYGAKSTVTAWFPAKGIAKQRVPHIIKSRDILLISCASRWIDFPWIIMCWNVHKTLHTTLWYGIWLPLSKTYAVITAYPTSEVAQTTSKLSQELFTFTSRTLKYFKNNRSLYASWYWNKYKQMPSCHHSSPSHDILYIQVFITIFSNSVISWPALFETSWVVTPRLPARCACI